MEHIINELRMNRDSSINTLINVHEILSRMTSYSKNCLNLYDSDLHEVFFYKELLNMEWGKDILGEKTYNTLNKFNLKWIDYRKNIAYSDDEMIIYLDKRWQEVIIQYLIPALVSIESDFNSHRINYSSYTKFYNPNSRPTDNEILERVNHLYELLLKNNIIKKYYIN